MTRAAAVGGTALTAVLAGIAAALGVFARGSGTFETVTSARGEVYEMAADGVYAHSSKALVAEGLGWDVFTLLAIVPALALVTPAVVRGSFRGLLVAAGLLGYAAYLYLEYAVTWAFGPMFPLHVGILAISVVGLVAVGAWIVERRDVAAPVDRYPRRAYAILTLGMSAMLTVLWSARIATGLGASVPELAGETTMTVQALDLGLVVPLSVVLAAAVLARTRAGELAGTAFLVLFVAMSGAIAAMMVSAWIVTGESTVVPLTAFTAAALAGAFVAVRAFGSVGPGSFQTPATRPSRTRAQESLRSP